MNLHAHEGGDRTRTLVVSEDEGHRLLLARVLDDDTAVVATPLDMIRRLEDPWRRISTVVLAGSFAANRELASFLLDFYPLVRVIDGRSDENPDTYLPAFA